MPLPAYQRLEILCSGSDEGRWEGLFQGAYRLICRGWLPEPRRLRVLRVAWPWLGWFKSVLPAPPRDWRPGGIFWFRSGTAAPMLTLAARFALDLAGLGYAVRLRATDQPGHITFEDWWQVAASRREPADRPSAYHASRSETHAIGRLAARLHPEDFPAVPAV